MQGLPHLPTSSTCLVNRSSLIVRQQLQGEIVVLSRASSEKLEVGKPLLVRMSIRARMKDETIY